MALIIIQAIYHGIIAGIGDNTTDERDMLIDLKAERIAGYVQGIGLFWLVGAIVASKGAAEIGTLSIAVWILFAITVSEISKLSSQIVYYRVDA